MKQQKEIGGYFGLEVFTGSEYHKDAEKLNLGRTALVHLMSRMGAGVLFVPRLLCDSVTDMCEKHGITLRRYDLDRQLEPANVGRLKSGEALLLVNYLGQLTDEKIRSAQARYGQIIVDHTHGFFQMPLPGVPTLYSCRKYFGLPDGAYLYAWGLPRPSLPADASQHRMGHILGRYEDGASAHFREMHQIAKGFYQESPKQMSALTENLLKSIDYPAAQARREENAACLDERLGARNLLRKEPPSRDFFLAPFLLPRGPFVYPFYHPQGIRLRKALAKERIYVPTYWNNVLELPETTLEYQCAANILPLPCDQRYGREEMLQMSKAVLRLSAEMED